MNKDQYKGGVFFKWINKNEIYAKHDGKGRRQNVQAYIDKLHQEYIASRPGTDFGYSTHGLFGYICDTDEVEMMDLELIKNRMEEISQKNIDVFKTVISLREEDAIEHGMMDKKAWKEVLEKTIPDIAVACKIPLEDLEWTASFHAKKGQPHCHLLLWNKNQNLEVNRKPFIMYKDIKKTLAKEIYKEELKALYDIKNVSKKQLEKLSKEELDLYKKELKIIYNNKDLMFNVVNTESVELYVNSVIKKMLNNQKIYIASVSSPDNYVEITKINDNEFSYKNVGPKAILYKEKSYLETTQFLTNFEKLCMFETKEQLQNYIEEKKNEEINIEEELKEIMPTVFNLPVISAEITEDYLDAIIKKIIELEEITEKYKKGFKYEYQTPVSKEFIDEISNLIINASKECKQEVERYIETCVNIDKVMQKIYSHKDYEKSRNQAKKFVMNKIGNQVLKFVKEMKTEEYLSKKKEWKEKRELWNKRFEQNLESKVKYEQRQELYEKQWQKNVIQSLIKETFTLLAQENLSKTTNFKRRTRTFGDLSKREIKELIRKNKNSSRNWYPEL